MVFIILQGCFPCSNVSIIRECECTNGTYGLYYGPEYEVAAILDSKIVRNKLYYLVDWLGYSPSERTWEPIENVTYTRALLEDFHRNVTYTRALLEDFHRQYPDKRGPQSKMTRDTRRFKGGIVS